MTNTQILIAVGSAAGLAAGAVLAYDANEKRAQAGTFTSDTFRNLTLGTGAALFCGLVLAVTLKG